MLINTVILFLRDLLPLFILLCYIRVIFARNIFSKQYIAALFAMCFFSTYIFLVSAEYIGEAFDGSGLEIFTVILLLLGYLCLVLADVFHSKLTWHNNVLILIGISSFFVVKASGFLIYFNVSLYNMTDKLSVFIGAITGLGICISFSVLFYFILHEVTQSRFNKLVKIGWYLFLAGQVSQILSSLSQVDIINTPPPIFNLSVYISDSSEYGHILNALVGYEASPSLMHIQLNIIAFLLPIILSVIFCKWCNRRSVLRGSHE